MSWILSSVLIIFIIIFANGNIIPLDNDAELLFKNNGSQTKIKEPKNVESRTVYLEDVLFAIKNQNWSIEEQPCLNESLRMIHSLRNFTLWAVWDWDSISSEPLGLLYGNKFQLGNFDECLEAPWSKTHRELKTQYCLADISLESNDNVIRKKDTEEFDPYQSAVGFIQHRVQNGRPLNELTWGICVPATCKTRSVERLFETALARSHLGSAGLRARISVNPNCQTAVYSAEFDWQFYTFSVFMILLGVVAIICTYYYAKFEKDDDNTPASTRHRILKAFSLKENTKDLMKVNREGAEVFYGIKFLTMVLIVADHQAAFFNAGPVINGLEIDKKGLSPIGALMVHDDLFVDTFFVMSGFLTAKALRSFKRMPNPFLLIMKRYLRLVIAFAVVIFYISSIFPHTGSGPLWPQAVATETVQCRKNWWINLLMINNYVDTENICMVTSWYVACDFQFFVVTVLMYWVYKKFPRLAWGGAVVLAVAAIIVPGIIVYTKGLPPVQLFTYEFIVNPRMDRLFQSTYIKAHTRFASYIVGFIGGCLFAYVLSTGNIKRLSTKWSVVGLVSGLIVMAASMLTGSLFAMGYYTPLEGVIYAALNRPAWAFGVTILVLSCIFGEVPLIKSFLCWYPWTPLSRLTYGMYLIHAIFITKNVMSSRSSHYYDLIELLTFTTGIAVWSTACGYIIWLLAEAPANNLLVLCLKTRFEKPKTENNKDDITPESNKNEGFIQENLPTVISVSSKV